MCSFFQPNIVEHFAVEPLSRIAMDDRFVKEINQFFAEIKIQNNVRLVDGKFGKMCVIKHEPTGKLFVKKSVAIKYVTEIEPMVHQLMKDNRYFIKLYYSLTTLKSQILILDYVAGGDLFDFLKKHKKVSEAETRSIVGQLTEALNALHSYKIIHNDLKLENVLYVRHKQIYLCDYGLCKIVNTSSCRDGTKEYMSPEKLKRQNYDVHVDWWALGILTYELLIGHHPYKHSNDNDEDFDLDVLQQRQQKKLHKYNFLSSDAQKFLEAMLMYNINYRLCTYETVIKHSFLS
uniref:Pk-1 n=4 Tax=Helicoverpa armigera nucleopolyhedrovirus TaxID=51313 RepID=A0A482EQS5_9ABAC|nr:pk-1 [Helicoverpa armigera nucleopolyhedrovirus]